MLRITKNDVFPWLASALFTFMFLVAVLITAAAGDDGGTGALQWLSDTSTNLLNVLLYPWLLLLKTGWVHAGLWSLVFSISFCSVFYGYFFAKILSAARVLRATPVLAK